jgi:GT2 family glycosyltransferase
MYDLMSSHEASLSGTLDQQPWLSVIMPTYNGARFIKGALDSLRRQADPGVEVIAIDDGSTDATPSILSSHEQTLSLRVLREERSGNWVVNTNKALAEATAPYVCFLHQDDLWLPGRLQTMKRLIRALPHAKLFLHSSCFIDGNGDVIGPWRCPFPRHIWDVPRDTVVEHLLIQNFIAIPAPIFRRDAVLSIGGLDPSLWYTADWDLWLKLALISPRIGYSSEILAGFRVHPASQTATRSVDVEDLRRQQEIVLSRHICDRAVPKTVTVAARLSIDVNVALAAAAHGRKRELVRVWPSVLRAGPTGLFRYFRTSRIVERLSARLRAARRLQG